MTPRGTVDERIHLIVLFGGRSAEHDVSCTSAAHVIAAADPARYRVTPIGISREGLWAIATRVLDAMRSGSLSLHVPLDPHGDPVDPTTVLRHAAEADAAAGNHTVVFPLLHGPMGEDGTVQGLLDVVDVPYVGSGVLGSALCMDKAMAKLVAGAAGLPQPRHRAVRDHERSPSLVDELIADLGLPMFVKPANMGSSIGVSKAHDAGEVAAAIDMALAYDEWIVVEEAVVGREIEVAVIGGLEPRTSLPGEIVPGAEFYDYADKYLEHASRTVVPAPLDDATTAQVRELARRAYTALRCEGLARVDFFYESGSGGRGLLLNEVNTMPGFTPISMYPKMWAATGLDSAALVDELVDLALDRSRRRRRNTSH